MAPSDLHPQPEAIRAALVRILASEDFHASERNKAFLRFIVEETLCGRADRLKAYTIALAVFNRDASFDPQTDPVIRVEAGRLRRCLERYYLTGGRADPVHIRVPKGCYVPHFAVTATATTAAPPQTEAGTAPGLAEPIPAVASPAPAAAGACPPRPGRKPVALGAVLGAVVVVALIVLAWHAVPWIEGRLASGPPVNAGATRVRGPSLLVLPFANGSGDPAQDHLAEGLTEEVVAGLTRFSDLFVFAAGTSFRYGAAGDPRRVAETLDPDYVVAGRMHIADGQIRAAASLIEPDSGRTLWSGTFREDLTAGNLFAIQERIGGAVVRALAEPYGAIFTEEAAESADRPPERLSSYECVLRSYQYWRRSSSALHAPVRDCLERTVNADPGYPEAWANLALMYIEEYRYGFNPRSGRYDPLEKALDAAHRAIDLAPNNVRAYQAIHLVHWMRHEVENSFAALEHALTLRPQNTDVLADLGMRYIFVGREDEGLPLLHAAFARNPALPHTYRFGFVVHHYAQGDNARALAEARRIDLPDLVYTHVALAMIHGQMGRSREGRRHVEAILRLYPDFPEQAPFELQKRNLHPALIEKILDGLRKAGLPVRSAGLRPSAAP